jgi:hypothetical protein
LSDALYTVLVQLDEQFRMRWDGPEGVGGEQATNNRRVPDGFGLPRAAGASAAKRKGDATKTPPITPAHPGELLGEGGLDERNVGKGATTAEVFGEEGTTVVATIITPEHIILANCGDSRAVIARDDICMFSTTDHKVCALLF